VGSGCQGRSGVNVEQSGRNDELKVVDDELDRTHVVDWTCAHVPDACVAGEREQCVPFTAG